MSVDCWDGEPNVVDDCERRRARQEHRCRACRETIRRGDLYFRHFLVWDGQAQIYKRCARCQILYEALTKLHEERHDGETAPAYALDCGDTYEQVFDEPAPPELESLAFLTAAEAQALLTAKIARIPGSS